MDLNALAVVYIGAGLLIAGVGAVTWPRRREPGGFSFMVLLFALAAWAGAYGFELAAESMRTMVLFGVVQDICIATLAPLWLAFSIAFSGRPTPSRPAWGAILVIPVLTVLFVLTNDLHHLFYSAVELDTSGPLPLLHLVPGPWYPVQVAYSFVAMSIGVGLLVGYAWSLPPTLRRQVLVIASAAIFPGAALVLYTFGVRPLGDIDITPLGFAIAALIIAHALFRHRFLDLVPVAAPTVIERIPIGVVVIDKTDRVVAMNPAAARIFDAESTIVIGSLISGLATGWDGLLDVLDRTEIDGPVAVRRTREGEAAEQFEVEVAPLEESGGRVVLVRDVTARTHAIAALRESETFVRGLVDNLPDMVVVFDRDRRILFVNPAVERLLGMPADRLVGTKTTDHVAAGSLGVVEAMNDISEIGRYVPPYEAEIRTVTGRTITVAMRIVPVPYLDRPARLALLREVTEQKELEAALHRRTAELEEVSEAALRANRALSLMNALTRHDINNQLVAIRGHIDLAQELAETDELADRLARTRSSIGRVEAMVRFMGEYASLGTAAPVWQHLSTLVRAAANGLPLEGVSVEDLTGDVEVLADALLERVLATLFENAVRHGGPALSRITIAALSQGTGLVITVEDDGAGVPSSEKDRIFEQGYGRNTGLGLFLAREVLAITGIGIAETGEPGRGARFELRVPAEAWRRAG